MSGFNEDSQMPEHPQGRDESLAPPPGAFDAPTSPSVNSTDRFGLVANGKGYLLRRYNIETSAAGNPYFTPIPSLLAAHQRDAKDVLELVRRLHKSDEDAVAKAETQALAASEYFTAVNDAAGEGREWVARRRVIWPLTNDLGFQLYKAIAGVDDLADFAAWLINTDANIQSVSDAEADERYIKRKFWSDVALTEAGIIDDMIQAIEETEYNLEWMVREGYRQQAMMDTRTHLRGVAENAPVDPENDVKAKLKASLMDRSVA